MRAGIVPTGPAPVSRFVAIGDSMTEGLNDGDDVHGFRGWADRLAIHLGATNPDLRYANLALRSLRAHEIRATQLARAIALEPDLVTVVAGMNDLIRGRFDAGFVAGEVEAMFVALRAIDAHVVTLMLPDVSRLVPIARPFRARILDFNRRIRAAAGRHDVTVVDDSAYSFVYDPRIWSADRLHASALGHQRIAASVADALGYTDGLGDWTAPFPQLPPVTAARRATAELRWLVSFFGPWVERRLTGRSSGDGRTAKHTGLVRVSELHGFEPLER